MPRVRLLTGMHVAGANHVRGDVVDVAGDVAGALTAAGRAEVVRGEQLDVPERPETEGWERTTRRARGGAR